MDKTKEAQEENSKALLEAREYLACQMDPGAFEPITSTWDYQAERERRRQRRAEAIAKASIVMGKLLTIMDMEYAIFYHRKAAQA